MNVTLTIHTKIRERDFKLYTVSKTNCYIINSTLYTSALNYVYNVQKGQLIGLKLYVFKQIPSMGCKK